MSTTNLPPISQTMASVDRLNQQMQRAQSVVRDMLGKQPQVAMDPAAVDQIYAAADLDFLSEPLELRRDGASPAPTPIIPRATRTPQRRSVS